MGNKDEEYEVKITDTAWTQMLEHARFLANVSVDAANRLVDDFNTVTDTLTQMPERCPWLMHDSIPFQKYRKIFIGKYHMVLFQVRGNMVYVSSVIDCRQDYSWLIGMT